MESVYTSSRYGASNSVRNMLAALLWAMVPPAEVEREGRDEWCKVMFAALQISKEELAHSCLHQRREQTLKKILRRPWNLESFVIKLSRITKIQHS